MTLARLVGVLGASGGLGAPTLSALLALRFAAVGGRAVCVDGAPYGGGLDVLFGLDTAPGVRWPDLVRVGEEVAAGPESAAARLPAGLLRTEGRAGVPVLSFDRAHVTVPGPAAWDVVLDRLRRRADLVVVDLPPAGDAGLPELLPRLDDVVLVVGDTPAALAAAATVHAGLDPHVDRWWLAQRTGRGSEDLPHAVSHALDVPLALAWPTDARLAADLARGAPPGGRGRAATAAGAALEVILGPRRRAVRPAPPPAPRGPREVGRPRPARVRRSA